MGALEFLKGQHRTFREFFKKLEDERDPREQGRILQLLIKLLVIHTEIEEKHLYPRLKVGNDELRELVLESLQEHHVVKVEIDEIEGLVPEVETCRPRIKVLKDLVFHHVDAEEQVVFPLAEKACGRLALDDIGKELEIETRRLEEKGTRLLITIMREEVRKESGV